MAKIKKIDEFEGYFITDTGKVLSEYKGNFKWLKQCKNSHGYLQVGLSKENKRYNKSVHRLIAEAFIPNPYNKHCIDHINGIRDDNRIENLRWCTNKENLSFPLVRKHHSELRKGKPRIEGSGKPPKPVAQYTKEGVLIAKYPSLMDAARQTGVNQGNISKCCLRKPNYNFVGGYKWAYLN